MKTRRSQSGMSMLGTLTIAVMVGFFVMCGLKMAPSYMEYMTVKGLITKVATESGAEAKTARELRRSITTNLNTNQVYGVTSKDIEIYKKEGKTFIDANYEARINVVGRIDAIISFDDLKFEVGKPVQ
ncbi:MAG: hypothetical protein ACJAUG_001573 [Halioglobus sp.]|jgi:hypothetical protein